MIPASFDESNLVLDKPADMTHEQCTSLSVLRGTLEDGQSVVLSCWKCTPEELAEINRTGRVWLLVYGTTMPPVIVAGKKPIKDA